jgi:hypothetical protein
MVIHKIQEMRSYIKFPGLNQDLSDGMLANVKSYDEGLRLLGKHDHGSYLWHNDAVHWKLVDLRKFQLKVKAALGQMSAQV